MIEIDGPINPSVPIIGERVRQSISNDQKILVDDVLAQLTKLQVRSPLLLTIKIAF